MRIRVGRGHEEFEFRVVVQLLVSQLNDVRPALFDQVLVQDGIDGWVELSADVLYEDPLSELDGLLNGSHDIPIGGLQHLDAFGSLFPHVPDELVGLVLRVDHQRESLGVLYDDSILNRCIVLGQAVDVPVLNGDWVSHEILQVGVRSVSNALHRQGGEPLLLQNGSVLRGEGPAV